MNNAPTAKKGEKNKIQIKQKEYYVTLKRHISKFCLTNLARSGGVKMKKQRL